MKFSNIFEKLEIVLDLIISSNVFIILMLLIIAVLLLKLTNKISNKKMGFAIYFIELIVLGIVFYEGKDFIIKTGSTLIDNIFLNFYFPSVYVYLFVFVSSFVIFIYTLLNRFISKTYRIVTNTYFLIFNLIFILLLSVISKNNINVFEKTSLFTNNDTLVLLELSTLLFFIYIVVNSLIYITNSIIMFIGTKKVSLESYDNTLELTNPVLVNEYEEKKESYVPNTSISFQELVKSIEQKEQSVTKIDLVPEVKNFNNNEFKFIDPVLFNEPFANDVIKTNKVESIEEKLNFIDFNILESKKEDKLTLNDYKLFSNMLKTVIKNNNDGNLKIEDILNKNLLSKYSFEEYEKFEKILNSCMN